MAANKTDPSAVEIGHMLHWVSRRHFQYADSCMQAVGIGPGQVPILMELGKHGQLSQRELAARVRVTAATMSGTLKRLERTGIVQRTGTSTDARISLVSLTEAGQERRRQAEEIFRQTDDALVADLTREEREMFLNITTRMLSAMDRALESGNKEGEPK